MGGVSGWHLRRSGESELFTRSLRIGLIPIIVAILPSVAFGVPQFSYRNKSGSDPVLSLVSGDMMMFAWLVMFLVAAVALGELISRRWMARSRFFFPMLSEASSATVASGRFAAASTGAATMAIAEAASAAPYRRTPSARTTLREDGLDIEVTENGAGPGADPPAGGSGNGLTGMRERAEAVRGTFAAGPAPGRGIPGVRPPPRDPGLTPE